MPEGAGISRVLDHAHAKSGDKLDRANVGLVCRSDSDYALLSEVLDAATVAAYLRPFLGPVPVTRYLVPGLRGINFVIEAALDGGSLSSRRIDRLAKSMSGLLLAMRIEPVEAP